MNDLPFNPKPPTVLHIDLNSCFATIEQQANPLIRNKPVAVAAYTTPSGCIIAPSVEAKKLGVRVGMRVKDGKVICPGLIILPPDPQKYRNVHLALRKIISEYTNNFSPKSIDEFVLDLEGYPALAACGMQQVASQLKMRIKKEVGEWLTVSCGIAPNRYLAKVAAGLHKPDGLDEINKNNFLACYLGLKLTDLPWIKVRNSARLNSMGIFSVKDFYEAAYWRLKAAFASIVAYYWFLRLRGWEIDDVEFGRRSYGNSYALPKPLVEPSELAPILSKLVEKASFRLRRAGYRAGGVHLAITYRDGSFWHRGEKTAREIFSSLEIYKKAFRILVKSPYKKPVRDLAVSCFNIAKSSSLQLEIFSNLEKQEKITQAVDRINERFGNFVITPARMLIADPGAVPDRIAFGGVKELEEFLIS